MPPISSDDWVKVQDLVSELQARVKKLENKLAESSGAAPKSASEEVRMILMGPPGAGTFNVEIRVIKQMQC